MIETNVTVAVTVYDRDKYLHSSVSSAVNQQAASKPQVMIIEDCGPNSHIREIVTEQFGDQVSYFRNPRRRGLIDNWNACIERCRTRWLCILHDDDILQPNFVAAMAELMSAAPGRSLYFGRWNFIDEHGQIIQRAVESSEFHWSEPSLTDWAKHNRVSFAGQLFDAEAARSAGGFRPHSRYTGDWDMWFRLALHGGAAATNRVVANFREHISQGRGTTAADVSGRKYAYVNVQRKRNFYLLRTSESSARFNRSTVLAETPLPLRWLVSFSPRFSQSMLRYNTQLFLLSRPPNVLYALAQIFVQIFSWRLFRCIPAWLSHHLRSGSAALTWILEDRV